MAAPSMEGGNMLCICDVAGQALMSEPSQLNRTCTLQYNRLTLPCTINDTKSPSRPRCTDSTPFSVAAIRVLNAGGLPIARHNDTRLRLRDVDDRLGGKCEEDQNAEKTQARQTSDTQDSRTCVCCVGKPLPKCGCRDTVGSLEAAKRQHKHREPQSGRQPRMHHRCSTHTGDAV